MQTVTINSGKSNAEVEISLCYCHGDTCNQDLSGAPRMTMQPWTILALAGFTSLAATNNNYDPWGMLLLSAAIAQPTLAEEGEGSATCYACGLPDVDPHVDNPGSYCDVSLVDNNCPPTSKIYNFSCDVMDSMGASDYWIRKCPPGIRSCFVAQGSFESQKPAFRGCAGAPYALDEKCNHRVQAVSVSATSNVDVDVHLCYCNSDVCNQDLSGAQRATTKVLITLVSTLLVVALQ